MHLSDGITTIFYNLRPYPPVYHAGRLLRPVKDVSVDVTDSDLSCKADTGVSYSTDEIVLSFSLFSPSL